MRDTLKARKWSDGATAVAVALFEAISRGEREPVHADIASILDRPPGSLDHFIAENTSAWNA
jgi:hypothetical protein